jgi:hypothetical protein
MNLKAFPFFFMALIFTSNAADFQSPTWMRLLSLSTAGFTLYVGLVSYSTALKQEILEEVKKQISR